MAKEITANNPDVIIATHRAFPPVILTAIVEVVFKFILKMHATCHSIKDQIKVYSKTRFNGIPDVVFMPFGMYPPAPDLKR
ncbi:MAG: hypothetical protein WKI04_01010 [Ferruginibacter sp.]